MSFWISPDILSTDQHQARAAALVQTQNQLFPKVLSYTLPSRKMLHPNSLVQDQKSKAERSSHIWHRTIFPPKIPFNFLYRPAGFKISLTASCVNLKFETGLQSMFVSLWFMRAWSCRPTPLRERVGCMKKLLTNTVSRLWSTDTYLLISYIYHYPSTLYY